MDRVKVNLTELQVRVFNTLAEMLDAPHPRTVRTQLLAATLKMDRVVVAGVVGSLLKKRYLFVSPLNGGLQIEINYRGKRLVQTVLARQGVDAPKKFQPGKIDNNRKTLLKVLTALRNAGLSRSKGLSKTKNCITLWTGNPATKVILAPKWDGRLKVEFEVRLPTKEQTIAEFERLKQHADELEAIFGPIKWHVSPRRQGAAAVIWREGIREMEPYCVDIAKQVKEVFGRFYG